MQDTSGVKPRLLAVLAGGQARLRAFADGLSDDERAAIGEERLWSAKDNVAHSAFWAHNASAIFAAIRGEGEPPPFGDHNLQPTNERVFAEWRARPWDETLAEAQGAFAQIVADVDRFSEEELTDTQRFPSRQGEPLMSSALGAVVWHPAEHYAQYYMEHGDPARATALQIQLIADIRDLFGPSELLGDAYYNLGCFYAKHGQTDEAIEQLRLAFPLHASLVAWSRQDVDLDSIRDLPAFQAFYAEQG